MVHLRLSYSLRSAMRRRRHFTLSWGLFVVAGAGFVCAMTVAEAWQVLLLEVDKTRHYAVEVRLNGAPDMAPLTACLEKLPGVARVEVWLSAPAAEGKPGLPAIERTYPDESHGAFRLVGAPPGAQLLTVPVHEGHWLHAQDEPDAVVINQFVPGYDTLRVGDTITLSIAGETHALRVVGKAIQIGVGATAYVAASAFSGFVPRAEQQDELWIAARTPLTAPALLAFTQAIEHELEKTQTDVSSVVSVSLVKNAMAAHFEVLIYSLLALAVLIASVGALGLGSALGVSLSERTRELGVLRSIGATGRDLRNAVILEGMFIGGLSIVFAVLVGFGLAGIVGDIVGRMSFRVPLPSTLSLQAVVGWSLGALALGALGGLLPARRAQTLSVRDALVWF